MINFPTSLDTLTNPTASNPQNSPSHSGQHSDANDAIEALEAKVGSNGSAVTTSHDYKLSGVTSTAKALSDANLDTDGTLAANSDTKIASQKATRTYADLGKSTAEGSLLNGKIAVTVASNNITLALKTLAGADATASTPIYCVIEGVIRSVTAALSVTKNAGTNWCNAGSAELATKEIDYFAYLGYNATDGVVLGFSRIPYACQYSDFSTTTTNEKYCAISTITNASATNYYNVIGRFAATLSAGAGYTWSVPTFTAINLIQRPIWETRWLDWIPVFANFTKGNATITAQYIQRLNKEIEIRLVVAMGSSSSMGTGMTFTIPFSAINSGMEVIGKGHALISGLFYSSNVSLSTAVIAYLSMMVCTSTYGYDATFSAIAPATWGTGSEFAAQIRYQQ